MASVSRRQRFGYGSNVAFVTGIKLVRQERCNHAGRRRVQEAFGIDARSSADRKLAISILTALLSFSVTGPWQQTLLNGCAPMYFAIR